MTFKLRNFTISFLFIIVLCGSLFFATHAFQGESLGDDYLDLNSAPPTAIDTSRERITQNHASSSHIQSTPTSTNNTIYIKNFEASSPSIESKPKSIRVIANSGYTQRFPQNSEAITNTICNPLFERFFAENNITILETPHEPRAWINGSGIALSVANIGPSEVSALLIHEGAHHFDLTRFHDNPVRTKFSSISWQASDLRKTNAKLEDFVSGYALTNDYEDFAESLTMFVLFNEEFAQRAGTNEALKKKYLFLQDFVFGQGEFQGTNYASGSIESYNWDTTRIEINQKKYANLAKSNIITSSCFELISPNSVVTQ
ncbi:MAG: hypothetical protein U0518_02495 [Candidatus Gracilibacteria bacterium]